MKNLFSAFLLCIITIGLCITISANDSLEFLDSMALQDGYIPPEHKVMFKAVHASTTIDEDTLELIDGIIIDAWANVDAEIDLTATNISYDQFYNVVLPRYSELLNNNPEFFYVRGTLRYSSETPYIQIVYNYDLDSIPEMIESFNEAVDEVVALIDTDTMNKVDIALAVHDYLVLNAEYDTETYETGNINNRDAFNAYGVLINKIGVCQSYTLAYNHILDKLGIETYPVTSSELNHIWSMVRIGDNYYHVDVTHDDPIIDRLGISKYTYFLCSDNELLSDGKHGKVWKSNYSADSDYYARAFWKYTRSTIAYLDGKYYAAVPGENLSVYNIVSSYSDNPEEMNTLREIKKVVWHPEGEDKAAYGGGQMYVNVITDGEYIYYNNAYNLFRYCDGYESDEIAFESGIKYGFMRPLPGITDNSLKYITVKCLDISSDVYSFSEISTAELSGHSFVETVTEPTDTKFGHTETTCLTCNYKEISDITNPLTYLIGDVDGAGAVDSTDTVILSRHLAKWSGYENLVYYFNCDVNNDGNINSSDTVILSRHLAKWTGYLTLPFVN